MEHQAKPIGVGSHYIVHKQSVDNVRMLDCCRRRGVLAGLLVLPADRPGELPTLYRTPHAVPSDLHPCTAEEALQSLYLIIQKQQSRLSKVLL
jgi:hypothetical protein